MEWARTHPYASALCAAGVLLVIGAVVVVQRASQPVPKRATAWGGTGAPLLDPTYQPAQNDSLDRESIMQQVKDNPPYTYIPPASPATSVPAATDNPNDFDAFIAMLLKGTTPKASVQNDGTPTLDAYAFIPRGLISTTTFSSKRSDVQQALYDYGNDIGSSIESFEQQHKNSVQILKEQAEDRADAGKAAAVVSLGNAFRNLGKNLAAMDTVPPSFTAAHAALAQSYIELGGNLSLIPQAERDSDFIQAIQTYNASADVFTKSYIRLVSLFGAYGVTFTSGDSGRVFTFSPNSL